MWFHLLSVTTFLALGSCQDFYGFSRKQGSSSCQGLGCPCDCPQNSCAPCPIPKPFECFTGCGTPDCPCQSSSVKMRYNTAQMGMGETKDIDVAMAVSTVNVRPTGPVCTASNLLPHMLVTVNTCIAGIAIEDLYVTVNTPKVQSLKVIEIVTEPYSHRKTGPILLITEKPSAMVNSFAVPAVPIDSKQVAELQKWHVVDGGMAYVPALLRSLSHHNCFQDEKFICAETYNTTVMGWNDIGTALVEEREARTIQGLYIGSNLYEPINIIKYMPLYDHAEWLFEMVEKYS